MKAMQMNKDELEQGFRKLDELAQTDYHESLSKVISAGDPQTVLNRLPALFAAASSRLNGTRYPGVFKDQLELFLSCFSRVRAKILFIYEWHICLVYLSWK